MVFAVACWLAAFVVLLARATNYSNCEHDGMLELGQYIQADIKQRRATVARLCRRRRCRLSPLFVALSRTFPRTADSQNVAQKDGSQSSTVTQTPRVK